MNLVKLRRVLPKLYQIANPKCPYRVVFMDPAGKPVQRHFKDKTEAQAYHRQLLAKASIVGTAGLVMDQEMRAEYFGARQALDGVPLMTAVRYYLGTDRPALRRRPLSMSSACSSRISAAPAMLLRLSSL